MPRRPALLALLCALAFAVAFAGCGEDDEGSEQPTTEATTEGLTKPEVEVPAGAPPKRLAITDITVGEGTEAQSGDLVSVHYVGVNFADGEEFDASWSKGEPLRFQVGAEGIIPGWGEGIPGMKIGGRRQLVIPPDQAYGKAGSPPDIGPNETLVFVIDLIDVQ